MSQVDKQAVLDYLRTLQNTICAALEKIDEQGQFISDSWLRDEGGGGESRVLNNGAVFEKAGVNFSHVKGASMPASGHRPSNDCTLDLTVAESRG